MPRDWAHWRGIHQHAQRVVLSYTVGNASVLEAPGFVEQNGLSIFTRDFEMGRGATELDLLVHEEPDSAANIRGNVIAIAKPGADGSPATTLWAAVLGAPRQPGSHPLGRRPHQLADPQSATRFQIAIWRGPVTNFRKFIEGVKVLQFPDAPGSLRTADRAIWGASLATKGQTWTNNAA